MPDYKFRVGDTEPITFTVTITSDAELSTGDVSSMKLYARKDGTTTNHVDGATVTVDSVSTSQSGGTWTNDFSCTFDPVGATSGGGDAFPTGSEGTYQVYVKVAWSDGDLTRHPAKRSRRWEGVENYES